jgi:hypothetical protein
MMMMMMESAGGLDLDYCLLRITYLPIRHHPPWAWEEKKRLTLH